MAERGGRQNTSSEVRDLGRVEGKLDQLLAASERERADSREDRRRVYERLEDLTRKSDDRGRALESLDQRLKKVEEPVAEFSRWRERAIGAAMLLSVVAATVGGVISYLVSRVWGALTGTGP